MARVTIRRDSRAISRLLSTGAVASAVYGLGDRVAANVAASRPGAPVVSQREVTDRARADVVIADPRARLWQARDGLLTRAAAGAGLEVRAWGGRR